MSYRSTVERHTSCPHIHIKIKEENITTLIFYRRHFVSYVHTAHYIETKIPMLQKSTTNSFHRRRRRCPAAVAVIGVGVVFICIAIVIVVIVVFFLQLEYTSATNELDSVVFSAFGLYVYTFNATIILLAA